MKILKKKIISLKNTIQKSPKNQSIYKVNNNN